MSLRFQKVVEDFECSHCSKTVKGSGYTNHCPHCLWSKHVDVNPGDRAETCGGNMQPIAIEGATPHYRIVHRCLTCKKETRISVRPEDSNSALNDIIDAMAENAKRGIVI